jgi:hypothetical protein
VAAFLSGKLFGEAKNALSASGNSRPDKYHLSGFATVVNLSLG